MFYIFYTQINKMWQIKTNQIEKLWLKDLFIFHMYELYILHVCKCMPGACKSQERRSLGTWVTELWSAIRVPRTTLKSSVSSASALHWWTTSPAPSFVVNKYTYFIKSQIQALSRKKLASLFITVIKIKLSVDACLLKHFDFHGWFTSPHLH